MGYNVSLLLQKPVKKVHKKNNTTDLHLTDTNNLGLLVADHITALLAYWDKNQVCRFANHAYLEWFGRTREEMVDKMNMQELLGPLYEKNLPFILSTLNGNTQQFEREIKTPSGEIRHTIANYYPDVVAGEVQGFFVHVADITKIKNLENELLASENKFRGFLESAPDAMVIVNQTGIIEIINIQTEKLFGYSKQELVGKEIEILIPSRLRKNHPGQRSGFFAKPASRAMGANLELFGLHKNGTEFPVEISISPLETDDGIFVSAAIRDTTVRKQQEKAINEMALIINSSVDAIIGENLAGTIFTWNKAAEKLFGYTLEEAKGKPVTFLFPPELWHEEEMLIGKILTGQVVEQYESVRVRKDGRKIDVAVSMSPIRDETGNIVGVSKIIQDISKRKEQEKIINELAMIISSSSDAIISNNRDGKVLTWNAGAEKLFGYTEEDVTGKDISLWFPAELMDEEKYFWANALNHKYVESFETVRLTKDRRLINVSITVSPLTDNEGNVVAISKIIRDITQQKKTEVALRESNERNKIFIQQAPNAIAMFDTEMRYMAASKKWLDDYGLRDIEVIGRSHYEIFPEIGDDWKATHQACLKGAIDQADEAPFERADGTVQWLTWDVRPWYISENNIGGLIMYTADITKSKEKDREKRRIEEILDRTNEVARIGTWEVDLKTNRVIWSRVTREIHEVGPDYEPSLDTAINFFKEGECRNAIEKAVTEAINKGTTYDIDVQLVTLKGNIVWTRAIGQAEFKDGVCIRLYGVFQDINEAKKSKEVLDKLNAELETLLNAGYVSIIATDTNGLITHFNKGAEMLLQYSGDEMVGKQTPALIHLREEVEQRGAELSEKFGKNVAGFDVFIELARQGEFESREWTYKRKNGSTFPVQLVVTAVKNSRNEITGYIGVATDISELKTSEQELKSLLEITTNQNERLKNFAHIVSHNLRSHSGNMGMILDLFVEENPEVADNEYVGLLVNATANLKETIANLNEVVLMNTSLSEKLTAINLHHVIDIAANNVFTIAKEAAVTVVNNVDPDITILALPAYMDSILLNFITNGIKYRSPGRWAKVILSASVTKDFIILKIEDNGLGIDLKRHGAKLFGMYKTFHGNEDARGIGLFITKNQVEAMGGKIEVESEPGLGTTFKIYLKYEKN